MPGCPLSGLVTIKLELDRVMARLKESGVDYPIKEVGLANESSRPLVAGFQGRCRSIHFRESLGRGLRW